VPPRLPRPVKYPASSDNRNGRDCIDDLRHERHRANTASIAARLAALCNDHVDAALCRFDSLRNGCNLYHHLRAGVVSLPHEVTRITESRGDNRRARCKGMAERFGLRVLGMWFTA
jgi:hypothetical protein